VEEHRHRKCFSLLFYRAVRDLKPVWRLEDMLTMETFYQEDGVMQTIYTPSEALLYAIVHDHQSYAEYLLSRFPDEALAKLGERFCCCPSSAPHLTMAVRYDRRCILSLILQETHRTPTTPPYKDRAECFHMEEASTPLHLACELLRTEAVIILLGNEVSPHVLCPEPALPNVALEVSKGEARQCLDILLMFMPKVRFQMKGALDREPERWSEFLDENTFRYLASKRPAPLLLLAMQTLLTQLSPATFPHILHKLPIPSSFFSGAQRTRKV
uniref:Uncharacterized protein n=1 Tax=Mola mola TaxID=94237 RepID=A0A3Q3WPK3_MOLML